MHAGGGATAPVLALRRRHPGVPGLSPPAVTERVAATYGDQDGVELDHLDGLTVSHADWSFNVRPSNTEPLLRLNVEGRDLATMERVRDEVLALIRKDV